MKFEDGERLLVGLIFYCLQYPASKGEDWVVGAWPVMAWWRRGLRAGCSTPSRTQVGQLRLSHSLHELRTIAWQLVADGRRALAALKRR